MSSIEKVTNTNFKLCKDLLENFKQLTVSMIKDDNGMSALHVLESVTNFFCNKLLQHHSTYKRNKLNEYSETFVKPEECAVGTRWEMKEHQRRGNKIPQVVQNSFQYISILDTLKSLFESKVVLECYYQKNTVLDHECVEGRFKYFCCGDVYRTSELFKENPTALQIQIASDDFEICSPLQSKANVHKICPIYFTIRNMPTKYLSKINNIHLIAVCNADDLKSRTTDFNNLWQRIVFELKHLERYGIEIAGRNLKGTLTHLSFDNLGANTSLGFVSSFSSLHYCRHCICSRNECREQTKEDSSKLRTKNMYDDQLKIINESEKVIYTETKGLKYYCKLNDLEHFHIMHNPTVDIMHDLHEGCIPFIMKELFKYVFKNNIFTESDLNSMVQFHNYGCLSQNRIPSMINVNKRSIGQNATQNLCLFRHLPFILYYFREDTTLKAIWPCITSLLKIVEIVSSFDLTNYDLIVLNREVNVHLEGIKNILHEHLRPKHHFLLHYEGIIRKMGPIAHMAMIRFEAKHQQLKKVSAGNMNFRNINKTITTKHQKAMECSRDHYTDDIECAKKKLLSEEFLSIYRRLLNYNNITGDIYETNRLRINNTEFLPSLLFIHDSALFQIKKILVSKINYSLLGQKFEIKGFDAFLNCIEIESNESEELILVDVEMLSIMKTFEIKNVSDGKQYILAATLDLRKVHFWG